MKTICKTLLSVVCAFGMGWIRADPAFDPGELSGAGGVMRDAERRARTPVPSSMREASVPELTATKALERDLHAVSEREVGPVVAVRIVGSTAFAAREKVAERVMKVLARAGDEEGNLTVSEISEAIRRVRSDLMKKGYYLCRILLARGEAYERATKTLVLLVDEGRFGRLSVQFGEGAEGTWFSSGQIARRFHRIKEGDSFDYLLLRGCLFDANSHPDLTIDTKINVRKPVEGDGASRRIARYADIALNVREKCPFHAIWQLDNYGVREVNEWQTSLTAQYLNVTKHDDVLTVSPAMSIGAELVSCAASYMLPHAYGAGGSTTLYGGWSQVQIDDIVPELDLEGSGWFAGVQHTENLCDNDRHLLAASVGVLWRYVSDQYTAASQSLRDRGVSILPLSLALSYTGKRGDFLAGRNFATVQGILNLTTSGDEIDKVWNDADEHYWLVRAQVARLQPLFGWWDESVGRDLHRWQLFSRVEAQYSDCTLIPVEKLMLGGYNCLRGYRTRSYVGDWGVYGTFEFRTPLLVDTFASFFGDRTDREAVDRLQFLAFFDWGVTQYNNLPDGYDDNKFLASAGLGVRAAVTKYSQLRCDWAMPLLEGNDGNEDRDSEVYVSVQLQF